MQNIILYNTLYDTYSLAVLYVAFYIVYFFWANDFVVPVPIAT